MPLFAAARVSAAYLVACRGPGACLAGPAGAEPDVRSVARTAGRTRPGVASNGPLVTPGLSSILCIPARARVILKMNLDFS